MTFSEPKANIFYDYTIARIGNIYKVEYFGLSGKKDDACKNTSTIQAGFTDFGNALSGVTAYVAAVDKDIQCVAGKACFDKIRVQLHHRDLYPDNNPFFCYQKLSEFVTF